jgi:hypothetical protein
MLKKKEIFLKKDQEKTKMKRDKFCNAVLKIYILINFN